MRCPDGVALAAWVDGEVVGPAADDLESHVTGCPRCGRAERTQRQLKRRTSLLREEVGALRPDPDLLRMLMSVPQSEHDRALRLAHRAGCGEQRHHRGPATRMRVAVVGAGAAVWLVAAVWSSPPEVPPAGTPAPQPVAEFVPASTTPAGTPLGSRLGQWAGPYPAPARTVAGR